MTMEHCWNDTDGGYLNYLVKSQFYNTSFTANLNWIDLGSNSDHRGQGSVTD